MSSYLATFAAILTLLGCAARPLEELTLADVAIKSAQKVKADALAPDAFRKAENYYLRAKKDYQDGYYDSCKKHANDARILAEQAEYKALLKQSQIRGQTVEETTFPSYGNSAPPGGP